MWEGIKDTTQEEVPARNQSRETTHPWYEGVHARGISKKTPKHNHNTLQWLGIPVTSQSPLINYLFLSLLIQVLPLLLSEKIHGTNCAESLQLWMTAANLS